MALKYWVNGTGTWGAGASSHWANVAGQSVSPPGVGDDAIFDANSGPAGTVVQITKTGVACKTLTVTSGFLGTFGVSGGGPFVIPIYGNCTLGGQALFPNTYGVPIEIRFMGSDPTIALTTNGTEMPNVTFAASTTTTYVLMDDLITHTANAGGPTNSNQWTINLASGILNANDKNVTTRVFNTNDIYNVNNSRTLLMGTGIWTIAGWNTTVAGFTSVWGFDNGQGNVSIDGSKATLNITNGNTTDKTLYLHNGTYKKIILGGATGINGSWWLYGGGTIEDLASTKTTSYYLRIDTANPLTVNNFLISGYGITVTSSSGGTQATLNTKTTSETFRVGANSTDLGNNTGITFTAGSELDNLGFQDINVVTTIDPKANFTSFF